MQDANALVDLADLVQRALAGLSVANRQVVVLRFFAGLTEQQTADALGIPTGTVKSRLSRAFAQLAENEHLIPPRAEIDMIDEETLRLLRDCLSGDGGLSVEHADRRRSYATDSLDGLISLPVPPRCLTLSALGTSEEATPSHPGGWCWQPARHPPKYPRPPHRRPKLPRRPKRRLEADLSAWGG